MHVFCRCQGVQAGVRRRIEHCACPARSRGYLGVLTIALHVDLAEASRQSDDGRTWTS